jgi:hypothetical protein
MCDDPTSCCGAREQLWTLKNHTVVNKLSAQCLTVHGEGMQNVGVNPCSAKLAGLQVWDYVSTVSYVRTSMQPSSYR